MKILDVFDLAIPEVKVIRFGRFPDNRGYFSEQYRFSDFETGDALPFMRGVRFVQANESFSRAGTIRGLHFQWNPYMGKLVRTIRGHMIDVVLDVRKGSPTYGRIIAHDMPVQRRRRLRRMDLGSTRIRPWQHISSRYRDRVLLLGGVQSGQTKPASHRCPMTSTGPSVFLS